MNRWAAVAIVFAFCLDPHSAYSTTRIVDPTNGPYLTIQSALEASSENDTVEVTAGIYAEFLRVGVSLTMTSRSGPGVTILDGEGDRRILEFDGVGLRIRGFTFRNGHAEGGGAAIRYHTGDLDVRGCVFADNIASPSGCPLHCYTWGGAILAGDATSGHYSDCLFTGNSAEGNSRISGSAIQVGEYPWGLKTPDGQVPRELGIPGQRIINCSFLYNQKISGANVVASVLPIEIRNSLFVDLRDHSTYISAPSGSTLACNMLWDGPSPQIEGTWSKREETGEVMDPLICPDDSLAVHVSSPAVAGWEGCEGAGNLPVGCTGPLFLAMGPTHLETLPNQGVRVFGYGLNDVLEARLVGPGGATVESRGETVDGYWLTVIFDLSNQSGGTWELEMRTGTAGYVIVGEIEVTPAQVWGFLNGWIPDPILYEGVVIGRDLAEGIVLELQRGQEGPILPVEVTGVVRFDSLHVQVDLREADSGPYDLLVHLPGGQTYRVQYAVFLGTPEIVRVPEDYPTITEALDAAAPCSRILVDPGTYNESLTIRKPVQLRSTGMETWRTVIKSPGPNARVIHVLPESGVLTEIEGFLIRDGIVTGPGGGIYCEAPALIRGNYFYANKARGPEARGGALCATGGARIIRNDIIYNHAETTSAGGDLWSLGPDGSGGGGAIFCLDCWVEGNHLEGNGSQVAGAIIADGTILQNELLSNWAERAWYMGALRGQIRGNHFDNCCGTDGPYMLIEGPSRVIGNRYSDTIWAMCGSLDDLSLRGSIDLVSNVFWRVGLEACLMTNDLRETEPGHFRMEGNFFSDYPGVDLHLSGCGGGPDPWSRIPPDSIRFTCNMSLSPGNAYFHDGAITSPCGCLFAPEHMPPGCPDTVATFVPPCDVFPVMIQSAGCEPTDAGVRLFWSVPLGVTVDGFDVLRQVGDRSEKLNDEQIPACRECEFFDRSPPQGQRAAYDLVVYAGGAISETHRLGEWNGEGLAPTFGLAPLVPNPVREDAVVRFTLPGGSRDVRLEVMDLLGRSVTVMPEGRYPAGETVLPWKAVDRRGRPLASGVYLMRLTWGGRSCTRAFVVLR